MPYFSPHEYESTPYYCPRHNQWYKAIVYEAGATMSCTVAHPPGDCCHMFEVVATPPGQQKSTKLTGRAR